MSDFRRYISAL